MRRTAADLLAVAANPVGDPERRRVGVILWLVGVIIVALLAGALTATFIGLRSDVRDLTIGLQASDDESASLADDVDTLRSQLLAAGEVPVVSSPDVSSDPPPRGDDGRPGTNGSDGTSGQQGDSGPVGPTGLDGPTGSSGTNGTDGGPGVDGANGANGFDGSQGPQGEVGPTGAQGPQGEVGPEGPQGFEGPPGQPPGSFRFTFDGVVFICTDPEGDGSYACNPEAP